MKDNLCYIEILPQGAKYCNAIFYKHIKKNQSCTFSCRDWFLSFNKLGGSLCSR